MYTGGSRDVKLNARSGAGLPLRRLRSWGASSQGQGLHAASASLCLCTLSGGASRSAELVWGQRRGGRYEENRL